MGKQRAEPDCLGADEEEAGKAALTLDEVGHPGERGVATWSEAALVAEELLFCTRVPKIPPAWAELYITQHGGYHNHEAQAFLAQNTIKLTGTLVPCPFFPPRQPYF